MGEGTQTELAGTVARITYTNQENHYTVLRLHTPDGEVTAVGTFPSVAVGAELRLLGEWYMHPVYGRQFNTQSYSHTTPATLQGLERYLGSSLAKGIGPALAKRLVAHFGLDTLKVISETPERLAEVPGMGPQRCKNLVKAVAAQQAVQDTMIFLQGLGVSPSLAARIYKRYGDEAQAVLRRNPYVLADEVHGVGFRTADRLARELGIGANSIERARAAALFQLERAVDEGHMYLPFAELLTTVERDLGVASEQAKAAVEGLAANGRLVMEGSVPDQPVYLSRLHWAEREVARMLIRLAQAPRTGQLTLEADGQDQLASMSLTPEQLVAVDQALRGGVVVITGGPGTGKTTIVRGILQKARSAGLGVLMAAPTGRAAKRLQEATGVKAVTIHRLLEYGFSGTVASGSFQRNAENPLQADMVVIDEASMLDVPLAYHLLRAIAPGTTLVLVGDADQLPSVGPGTALRDIIQSGCVPVIELTTVFRQAQRSMIVVNAHRINQGQEPIYNSFEKDFYIVEEAEPAVMSSRVGELVTERLPRYLGCSRQDIQVLSPVRRGPAGVDHLNIILQKALNPRAQDLPLSGVARVLPADRVMQIRNNYDKGVFNGDIGLVLAVNETGEVLVEYPDREEGSQVEYEQDERNELSLAYAMSVHKSQGSEFPVVVMLVPRVMPALMTRNLLYTAVTRARRFVVLVGEKRTVALYVRNNKAMHRFGLLADRLVREKCLSCDDGSFAVT